MRNQKQTRKQPSKVENRAENREKKNSAAQKGKKKPGSVEPVDDVTETLQQNNGKNDARYAMPNERVIPVVSHHAEAGGAGDTDMEYPERYYEGFE